MNTPGSYRCLCKQGYEVGNGGSHCIGKGLTTISLNVLLFIYLFLRQKTLTSELIIQNGVSRQCHRECTLMHARERSENANASFNIRYSFSSVDAGKRCQNVV